MDDRQKHRVRRLVASGMTVPDIADRMGIKQQRVYRYCKAEGISIVPARGRLPESITDLRRAIAAMKSVDAVASHFGVTCAAVYYRLSQARRAKEKKT